MNPQTMSDQAALSLATRSRIDRLCLGFEDAWRRGETPRLEEYLAGAQDADREPLFRELLLIEWAYLVQRGQQPAPEAYETRFAEFARTVARLAPQVTGKSPRPRARGERVARYEIQRVLGQGTFGAVYLAWDEKLQRHVAIKEAWTYVFETQADVDRAVAESRAIAALHHPGIVGIFDVIEEAGLPLIVMEFVAGPTLNDAREGHAARPDRILEQLIAVAHAVDFAHRRGFIHRDLKPGNIRLDSHGRPRVLDFGLALHESTQRLRVGESAGSLRYMAPEQLNGDSQWLDGRADIWALGVMLYELLTGRPPFSGENVDQVILEILCREPKPPRQIDRGIPRDLERICLKCLRKPIAERYTTAADLADDLERFLARHSWSQDGQAGWTPRPRTALRRRFLVGCALLGLPAAAGFWWMRQRSAADVATALDLRVWDATQSRRQGIGIREAGALPLRPGDQVRLEICVHPPAFAYVLWIDALGGVAPVYPWVGGQWSRRGAERKLDTLSLPSAAEDAWTMQSEVAGMDTVVLLLSDRPCPDLETRIGRIGPLKPQVGPRASCVLEWDNGPVAAAAAPRTRAPDLGQTQPLQDPVLRNQFTLAKELAGAVRQHYALSFPVADGPPSAEG